MNYPDQLVITGEIAQSDDICVEVVNHNNNDLLEIAEGYDQAVYLTKGEAEKLLEALPAFIAAMKEYQKVD